jgi:hypothetical protein
MQVGSARGYVDIGDDDSGNGKGKAGELENGGWMI